MLSMGSDTDKPSLFRRITVPVVVRPHIEKDPREVKADMNRHITLSKWPLSTKLPDGTEHPDQAGQGNEEEETVA